MQGVAEGFIFLRDAVLGGKAQQAWRVNRDAQQVKFRHAVTSKVPTA